MNMIVEILQDLAAKPIGIEGLVLVNGDGQLMSNPLGIDENSAQIMAGTILYWAQSTQNELNWRGIESVAIRAQEGHLILTHCAAETFLLIKAGKTLTGLLESEIHNAVKKLQNNLANPILPTTEAEIFTKIEPEFLERCQKELARCIGPVASFIIEDIFTQFSPTNPQKLVDLLSQEIPDSQKAKSFKEKLS